MLSPNLTSIQGKLKPTQLRDPQNKTLLSYILPDVNATESLVPHDAKLEGD